MIAGPIARWWQREWAGAGPHWKDDARRGFLFGVSVGVPVAAWLGLA